MTISRPCYSTRELVLATLDVRMTARLATLVDNAISSASDDVDKFCHRQFWPWTGTRKFDWPTRDQGSWWIWLDEDELTSLATLVAGGTTITGYKLWPRNAPSHGEPYTKIEIDLGSSAAFEAGDTHQENILGTGVYGFTAAEVSLGTLSGSVNAGVTSITLSASTDVGVGDLVRVDSERMLVTGRTQADSGQNLAADLAASVDATAVSVASGAGFTADEVILIGGERMLVTDIAGNTLVVTRAWDDTTLAAHTSGADVYALRGLSVSRGAAGTTAASHTSGTAVARNDPPAPVREYTTTKAINILVVSPTGGLRTVGGGNLEREATGVGLAELRDRVYDTYARKARLLSV